MTSSKSFHTPLKIKNLMDKDNFKNKTRENRKTVFINESQNEVQNYDPEGWTDKNTKDGLNSSMRKFLFKELDKIRSDTRQNNANLSKNISDNEEFYTQKFDELKIKLK